jgi:DNA-binding XRE family transcriptional regulator
VSPGPPVASVRPVTTGQQAQAIQQAAQRAEPLRAVPSPDRPGRPGPLSASGRNAPPTFADWMQDVLRTQGLTQEAAARQLGVSVKTVSRWVGGATEPRMRDLRRIQEVFGEVPLP